MGDGIAHSSMVVNLQLRDARLAASEHLKQDPLIRKYYSCVSGSSHAFDEINPHPPKIEKWRMKFLHLKIKTINFALKWWSNFCPQFAPQKKRFKDHMIR